MANTIRIAVATILSSACFFTAVANAECTREGLLAAAASYLTAQRTGSIDGLPLAAGAGANFTYRENNAAADIDSGSSMLAQALAIDLNRTSADVEACASYTLIISSSGATPYVIGTQIRHPADNDTSQIASIDTIAATAGDLFFDAARTLALVEAEDWGELAEADRPAREELRRIGDAYLDMWTDAGAADSIPWGTDCERVEGSALTRPCGATLPRGGSATPNGNRRYVIDEVLGSVDVLCSFDSLGDMPDSHEVRVEAGKVKYVHTITVLN
ncbi:H/ACA snoRNP pseudouridylase subunit [Diatrype stigma]|uniref:H/ACA snoRNP pseudouridylase subunit n=1 Tax=Diatrype stigma TaxID=117547 RepID=A0AAN9U7Y9_9PEZI